MITAPCLVAQRYLVLVDFAEEAAMREAAMHHLRRREQHDAVSFSRDERFSYHGQLIRFMNPQTGIWKPRQFSAALSISTTYTSPSGERPYEDSEIGEDGLGRYKWRGTNPQLADNRALREAMNLLLPLIWFRAFAPGKYAAVYPIYLVKEEPEEHQFVVAVDAVAQLDSVDIFDRRIDIQLAYANRETKQRLHQAPFRGAVLSAYECRCAICRFGHASLLDAAHIIPDSEGGQPAVTNGLSLCKMHHGAYDSDLIGITPDFEVRVNQTVLNEQDGPMLRYGIQEFHGRKLMALPEHKSQIPNRDALSSRYRQFVAASGDR